MKYLIFLLFTLFSFTGFSQGQFGPDGDLEPLGPYPIVKMQNISGGLHVLQDTSLLETYLHDSVMVFQKSNSKFYRFLNGTWIEVPTGGEWEYPDLTPSTYAPGAGPGDTLAAFANAYSPGSRAYIIGANVGTAFAEQGLEFNAGASAGAQYFFNRGGILTASSASGSNLANFTMRGSSVYISSLNASSETRMIMNINSNGASCQINSPYQEAGFKGYTTSTSNGSIDSIRINQDAGTYLPRQLVSELIQDSISTIDLSTITANGATTTEAITIDNTTTTNLLVVEETSRFNGNWIDNTGTTLSNGESLVSNGSVLVATEVAQTITYTASIDFPSIAAGASADELVSITGVVEGDVICLTPVKGAYSLGLFFQAFVNGPGAIVVKAYNPTAGAVDLGEFSYYIKIIKG